MSTRKTKRVGIIADKHCGHLVGLTPPSWQISPERGGAFSKFGKWSAIEKECWASYSGIARQLGRLDLLVVNADSIDGRNEKQGGTELITGDREEQCDMAVACIREIKADKIIMTYGTDYHTAGGGEDWERLIAEEIHAENIGSHEWIDVNGCVFDVKHHIGSSGIPHGRATALGRDRLWNALWAEHGEQPRANVIVRSHVHYCVTTGEPGARWLALTTPALQAMGTKFGSRRCSGHVDWGLVWFEVSSDGDPTPHWCLPRIESQGVKVTKI